VKRVAAALELARATRSRIGKEVAIGDVLALVGQDDDPGRVGLMTVARLASGRTLAVGDGRVLGVGWSLLGEVACAMTGEEPDVLWECTRKTGDLGEAFGLLVRRMDVERPGLSLREVADLFDAVAGSSSRLGKRRLLDAAFARASWLETKFLGKALQGALRIGAQAGVVEGAIARAFHAPLEEVRRAAALVTDLGVVAALAADARLGDARLEVGRPLAFMLATPIEAMAAPPSLEDVIVEDKIDGIRAQVHKAGPEVSVFARGLDRVTGAYPEIVDGFRFVRGSVVLDGEIVVMGEDGKPRPFQTLQIRLRKMAPTAAVLAEAPVTFVAYDLLHLDGEDLMALPWKERRARLEAFQGPREAFRVNPCRQVTDLDAAFEDARTRGYEGLVLKRQGSAYEAGRRGQSWIKVKKAYATLDVVVTFAQEGHGKRAGVLSDYTFAVWSGEELVNVGKAYSGLTDEEIDELTRRFERTTVEKFGGVRQVKPEVVLEVAFDGVQKSSRHKSGYALRFPRIVRIRADKLPEEADRIAAVQALYDAQVASGHREESKKQKRTPKARPAKKQLSLFGDDD
jgi:DNA ligase-1